MLRIQYHEDFKSASTLLLARSQSDIRGLLEFFRSRDEKRVHLSGAMVCGEVEYVTGIKSPILELGERGD